MVAKHYRKAQPAGEMKPPVADHADPSNAKKSKKKAVIAAPVDDIDALLAEFSTHDASRHDGGGGSKAALLNGAGSVPVSTGSNSTAAASPAGRVGAAGGAIAASASKTSKERDPELLKRLRDRDKTRREGGPGGGLPRTAAQLLAYTGSGGASLTTSDLAGEADAIEEYTNHAMQPFYRKVLEEVQSQLDGRKEKLTKGQINDIIRCVPEVKNQRAPGFDSCKNAVDEYGLRWTQFLTEFFTATERDERTKHITEMEARKYVRLAMEDDGGLRGRMTGPEQGDNVWAPDVMAAWSSQSIGVAIERRYTKALEVIWKAMPLCDVYYGPMALVSGAQCLDALTKYRDRTLKEMLEAQQQQADADKAKDSVGKKLARRAEGDAVLYEKAVSALYLFGFAQDRLRQVAEILGKQLPTDAGAAAAAAQAAAGAKSSLRASVADTAAVDTVQHEQSSSLIVKPKAKPAQPKPKAAPKPKQQPKRAPTAGAVANGQPGSDAAGAVGNEEALDDEQEGPDGSGDTDGEDSDDGDSDEEAGGDDEEEPRYVPPQRIIAGVRSAPREIVGAQAPSQAAVAPVAQVKVAAGGASTTAPNAKLVPPASASAAASLLAKSSIAPTAKRKGAGSEAGAATGAAASSAHEGAGTPPVSHQQGALQQRREGTSGAQQQSTSSGSAGAGVGDKPGQSPSKPPLQTSTKSAPSSAAVSAHQKPANSASTVMHAPPSVPATATGGQPVATPAAPALSVIAKVAPAPAQSPWSTMKAKATPAATASAGAGVALAAGQQQQRSGPAAVASASKSADGGGAAAKSISYKSILARPNAVSASVVTAADAVEATMASSHPPAPSAAISSSAPAASAPSSSTLSASVPAYQPPASVLAASSPVFVSAAGARVMHDTDKDDDEDLLNAADGHHHGDYDDDDVADAMRGGSGLDQGDGGDDDGSGGGVYGEGTFEDHASAASIHASVNNNISSAGLGIGGTTDTTSSSSSSSSSGIAATGWGGAESALSKVRGLWGAASADRTTSSSTGRLQSQGLPELALPSHLPMSLSLESILGTSTSSSGSTGSQQLSQMQGQLQHGGGSASLDSLHHQFANHLALGSNPASVVSGSGFAMTAAMPRGASAAAPPLGPEAVSGGHSNASQPFAGLSGLHAALFQQQLLQQPGTPSTSASASTGSSSAVASQGQGDMMMATLAAALQSAAGGGGVGNSGSPASAPGGAASGAIAAHNSMLMQLLAAQQLVAVAEQRARDAETRAAMAVAAAMQHTAQHAQEMQAMHIRLADAESRHAQDLQRLESQVAALHAQLAMQQQQQRGHGGHRKAR